MRSSTNMSKNLENKNEELNHTIQDLENKLAAECKERERAQEADRIEREKQLETLKQSMREEMLNMIGAQPTATQKVNKVFILIYAS
jgi:rubrerythrin